MSYNKHNKSAKRFRDVYWKTLMPPSPWIKCVVIDKDGFAIGHGEGIDKIILGRAWV